MKFELNNIISVTIENIPIEWIPKIELYYPDLPQFPIMYIHLYKNETRVIGCPVIANYELNGKFCNGTFIILSNVEGSDDIRLLFSKEIKERIGFSNKIGKNDLSMFYGSNDKYKNYFNDLWSRIKRTYGDYIPYGKFYEEIYSIVRFVSAFAPKTGRQSEMRMLYNFMKEFGEKVSFPKEFHHLEFYVIPTINDLGKYNEFPKFNDLVNTMDKVYNALFIETVEINGHKFKVLPKAWKQSMNDFIQEISTPLYNNKVINEKEKLIIENLVNTFNRLSWRASFFISSFEILVSDYSYSLWDKDFFINFYLEDKRLKGYSEKVIACFLQQGFKKDFAIPIDTWIETFHKFTLGIEERKDFFNSFEYLGKMERLIWLSSQANKTNMTNFYDVLWCQRYGTNNNRELMEINPLACYRCAFNNSCVGLSFKNNSEIGLIEAKNINSDVETEKLINKNLKLDKISYICVFNNSIPKKIYKIITNRNKKSIKLIDEFSGYSMDESNKVDSNIINKKYISFSNLLKCIGNKDNY